jgi:hypothetical protein
MLRSRGALVLPRSGAHVLLPWSTNWLMPSPPLTCAQVAEQEAMAAAQEHDSATACARNMLAHAAREREAAVAAAEDAASDTGVAALANRSGMSC